MITISKEKLKEILKKHKKWLNDEVGGVRAILTGADLSYADLKGTNLKSADLRRTNLCGAILQFADLTNANLSGANLKNANLESADLRLVNLQYASLNHANLQGAKLSRANLKYAGRPWLVYAGPIGSRKAETLYFADYDIVHCGCWNNYKGGTLAEFKARIDEVYPADSENKEHQRYRLEYLSAIKMFETMREAYLKKCNREERDNE